MSESILNRKYWIRRGIVGFIGFLLSPLSWWNDIFVNLPLAYVFAYLVGKLVDIFYIVPRWLFTSLFIIGYFLTNLIGFLMIHYSLVGKSEAKESAWKQILIALIYTLIIILLAYLDIFNLNLHLSILPTWVIK
jgi:hypothetical protein